MIPLSFLVPTLSLAQAPEPIRVTTRMVEVSAVVHDKKGRAVTGLGREDFRLTDGGRQEGIRVFFADDTDAHRQPAARHIATVILLDQFNASFEAEAYGRLELLAFLHDVEPGQPIALLSLGGELAILHDFTTDKASLMRALERFRPKRPIVARTFRPSRTGIKSMDRLDDFSEAYKAGERALYTTAASAALGRYLARFPGRKNLIWVSNAFPAVLAASVRQDDVAIYPVDVNCPIFRPDPEAQWLADRTGGIASFGNDLRGAIAHAYDDSRAAYVVGYYPSHGAWNGQFRPIRLVVDRPDVEVRHRTGYVAVPDTPR